MKESDTCTLSIEESVIKKTKDCTKCFACLNGNGHQCCSIKDCINNKVYFLGVQEKVICSYVINFGNDQICTCPVRKEIYNKLER